MRVGYRHQREDLLAAAVEVARADGLGALTFGRVARHVGTNDRTVVYYFPTKADLIGAVLVTLGAQLQDLLAQLPKPTANVVGVNFQDLTTEALTLGFDVDVGPLFATPEEVARQAADNDVHVVGVSSLAAGHLTLVPALREALAEVGRPDIMIVVGGVIPPGDFDELYEAGAAEIFPPGTVIADSAVELIGKLADSLDLELAAAAGSGASGADES